MTTQAYVGQPLLRYEDDRLLRGAGEFTGDITLPGMAHAAIVRSPHAHARITGIDSSRALAMEGVLSVLTADDLEGIGLLESVGRPGMEIKQGGAHPVLAMGRALYAGQAVALVAAETLAQATDAASQVVVSYEPLEAVNDLEAAAGGRYPPLHPVMESNVGAYQRTGGGDVEGAFAAADRVVSGSFVIPRLAPMAIEAARHCISSPLLEDATIEGARGLLISVTGSSKLGLHEVHEASSIIQKSADPEANIIFGAVLNEDLGDDVKIIVIATGFRSESVGISQKMSDAVASRLEMRSGTRQASAAGGGRETASGEAQAREPLSGEPLSADPAGAPGFAPRGDDFDGSAVEDNTDPEHHREPADDIDPADLEKPAFLRRFSRD